MSRSRRRKSANARSENIRMNKSPNGTAWGKILTSPSLGRKSGGPGSNDEKDNARTDQHEQVSVSVRGPPAFAKKGAPLRQNQKSMGGRKIERNGASYPRVKGR